MQEYILAISAGLTVLVEVLKRSPKIPVNAGNAMVVVFVLAVIIALVPALLNGSLTVNNAETLAQNVAIIFGASTIVYEAVKKAWTGSRTLIKK